MGAETVTRLVPDTEYDPRTQKVGLCVLHHGATTSLSLIESLMDPGGRTVSAHYAVKDGVRVRKVPQSQRAFSLSSAFWDSKAVTCECANESTTNWTISEESHKSLVLIVVDAAREFGFWPHRDGDPKTWTVLGHREVYTIHGASYPTACPGGMDLDRIATDAQKRMSAPAPPVQRRRSMSTLYYTKDATGSLFALAGDGLGTAAWLETRDQSLANALAAQHGNAAFLTPGSFASWKKRYLDGATLVVSVPAPPAAPTPPASPLITSYTIQGVIAPKED